jgi:hypothetical protein
MGEGGGDRGDGQVIAIASFLVEGGMNAVEMVVVSFHDLGWPHDLGWRVGGDGCDGVMGLGEHQRRSLFLLMWG